MYYKVNEIGPDKKIKKIIVFSGSIEGPAFDENNIPLYYSKQQIHYDDSIGTIYIKIVNEYGRIFAMEEIYLYCLKDDVLDPYKTLMQYSNDDKISKMTLDNYLSNIKSPLENKIVDKEVYDYDDILKLDITGKSYTVAHPIGQEIGNYTTDPFDNKLITGYKTNISVALSNNLLLNSGKIIDNNIYLCLASDVLSAYASTISSQLIKIYYPLLAALKINTLSQIEDNTQKLIEENEFLKDNESTETLFKKIDLFYDIYNNPLTKLKYIKPGGIKFIKLVIHPAFNVKIPLDTIFKLLHATEKNPFIKYNPASRQEKIYRLFTDKMSKDGRKIPLLSKADVIRYGKSFGKTKSVAVIIYSASSPSPSPSPSHSPIICEFEDNGNIVISSEFEESILIDDIDKLFNNSVNDIIGEVKIYLEQSGYKINLFNSITDQNVEIKLLTYQTVIKIDTAIKLDNIIGCISSAFNVETSNIKKGIEMRFKRVANFNKTTSQEAYIIEQINQKSNLEDLVNGLIENFSLKQEDAIALINKISDEFQINRGIKKNIEIKINPGFKTTIVLNQYNANIKLKLKVLIIYIF